MKCATLLGIRNLLRLVAVAVARGCNRKRRRRNKLCEVAFPPREKCVTLLDITNIDMGLVRSWVREDAEKIYKQNKVQGSGVQYVKNTQPCFACIQSLSVCQGKQRLSLLEVLTNITAKKVCEVVGFTM